ncbi:MAG: VWA domain-containing protein [Xanthomonadales bacterium]|jgi:Ca-activated chloride channel family protein|nr:VWA domain-containing protein [Xanthomonadales bacterium]
MNQKNRPVTIRARWDQAHVPTGSEAQRGLLLEIEAHKPKQAEETHRPPVNVALVIDRSGSMRGEPMQAAIDAAVGVAEQMHDDDRLSVVCYDSRIEVLVDGELMSAGGRKRAEIAIRGLQARSTTDLAGGWLQGARCVAGVMEKHGFESGHVILLSDGCANVGECSPEKLAGLAADLAERNVTSTCVGIGAHYSLLQMAAIAEAGQGEMHQSSEPYEIVEVLLGELGEQAQIVARNFSIHIKGKGMREAQQLTRYRKMPVNGREEYYVGNLVAGQSRRLAFLVEFPAMSEAMAKEYTVTATWLDPETALEECTACESFRLKFVSPDEFDPDKRDKAVAEVIAEIWMARTGYEAMMLNERGLFGEAVQSFDVETPMFCRMVDDLECKDEILQRRESVREATASRWDGMSKKEAVLLARKRMRSKPDYRRAHASRDWADIKPK